MGPHHSSATSSDFNPKEWHYIDQESSQSELKGNYKVLENIHTGELIDEYKLIWPSEEDFRFYLDSYLWRRQEYNIVASRFIVEQHSEKFCSRSYTGNVYIEHIPTRLSDVTDIPYPDNLYVGLAIMDGYQKLYENVHHYFPVAEDQICVDREGVVKVWVNSDLSKNYPEPENELSDNKDESNMVDELLNLLWENTDEESEPVSFKEFYMKKKGKKRIGFDEAKVIINEYAKSVSCQIPERFNSILQMIDESDEYQHTNNEEVEEEQHHGDIENEGYQNNFDERARQNYEQHYNQLHQGGQYQDEHQDGQYPAEFVNQAVYPVKNVESNVYSVSQQRILYDPVSYNRGVIQNVSSPLPAPLVVNPQFIPRQVTPSNGHIITIPPIPGRYNVHPLPIRSLPNPSLYETSFKNQQEQSYQSQNILSQAQQEEAVRLEELSNKNQGFEKHVSMLNPPEGEDFENQQEKKEEFYQERETNEFMGQFSNRKDINVNYPVGRSLQFPNQAEQEALRTNKSQIDQKNQENYQIPYNKIGFEQQDYYESNRYSGVNQSEREFNHDNFRYQNNVENSLDTKYYTLDTEVDLDEEIAADLRKMIRAG